MSEMSSNESSTNTKKQRLTEIAERVDGEDVSTDELLDMLEEAVNIGMDVCEQAQNNINSQIANEALSKDEQN